MAPQQGYPVEEARRLFIGFAERYALTYSDKELPDGDLDFKFLPQSGLLFSIWLALQNGDELHIQMDDFNSTYYPCTEPEVRRQFEESVNGLLSGQWRIMSHVHSWGMLRATLQRPDGDAWRDVRHYTRWGLPF